MPGKRVQFDDETWQAIDGLATTLDKSFQSLADEAFKDLLKKHHQPVGLKAALKESVAAPEKPARKKS
jgi:predicted transcriptional regulator